jgi:hypothetical protein
VDLQIPGRTAAWLPLSLSWMDDASVRSAVAIIYVEDIPSHFPLLIALLIHRFKGPLAYDFPPSPLLNITLSIIRYAATNYMLTASQVHSGDN